MASEDHRIGIRIDAQGWAQARLEVGREGYRSLVEVDLGAASGAARKRALAVLSDSVVAFTAGHKEDRTGEAETLVSLELDPAVPWQVVQWVQLALADNRIQPRIYRFRYRLGGERSWLSANYLTDGERRFDPVLRQVFRRRLKLDDKPLPPLPATGDIVPVRVYPGREPGEETGPLRVRVGQGEVEAVLLPRLSSGGARRSALVEEHILGVIRRAEPVAVSLRQHPPRGGLVPAGEILDLLRAIRQVHAGHLWISGFAPPIAGPSEGGK